MKARLPFIVAGATIVGAAGSFYLFNGLAHGEWDPTQLENQVQQNTSQLQNHETRITNLENNAGITHSPLPSPAPTATTTTTTSTDTTAPSATPVTSATPTPSPTLVSQQCVANPNDTANGRIENHWSDGSITYGSRFICIW